MNTAPLGRIIGIDLARFLAIIGMMAAHLIVAAPTWLHTITSGYPSALFAVLGGFGVTFASRRYRGATAVVAIACRGVVVALIGWLLELLPDHNIAVVLIYFGVAIVLSAAFLWAPTWFLWVAAVVIAGVSAQLTVWFRTDIYQGDTVGALDYDSLGRFFG